MLDWLRRDPRDAPTLEVGGRTLPITVRRNPLAKRMTLRLAPDGGEVVSEGAVAVAAVLCP